MGNSTTKIELKMVRYYNHQMKYMFAITLEEMFGCFVILVLNSKGYPFA